MRENEAAEKIAVAYTNLGGGWVRIEKIAKAAGLSAGEMAQAVTQLVREDEGFRAEPQPFNHRITAWDKVNAPNIGGEARHLIKWD